MYNWTGAIRVPAPCFYSHKRAYLLGQTCGEYKDKVGLSSNLFYL